MGPLKGTANFLSKISRWFENLKKVPSV